MNLQLLFVYHGCLVLDQDSVKRCENIELKQSSPLGATYPTCYATTNPICQITAIQESTFLNVNARPHTLEKRRNMFAREPFYHRRKIRKSLEIRCAQWSNKTGQSWSGNSPEVECMGCVDGSSGNGWCETDVNWKMIAIFQYWLLASSCYHSDDVLTKWGRNISMTINYVKHPIPDVLSIV
jgi:hypothetical protein